MKKILAFCGIVIVCITMMAANGATAKAGKTLEVSFEYEKQSGPGSNQYAVWVENDQEQVVKTLFVTTFTSKGRARGNQAPARGYTYRPTCVPTWVTHAKAAEMSDQEIDGFTGATPQGGRQVFTWDLKDKDGKDLPKGTYKVCVEATLFNNSIVLYTGTFTLKDKAGEIKLTSSLTQPDEQHANMIKAVQACLK